MTAFVKKYLKRWRKAKCPPEMQHMATLHPAFKLVKEEADIYKIYWKDKEISNVKPVTSLLKQRDNVCFVFANGPSLSEVPIEKIAVYPSFGVNGAIVKFRGSTAKPTYYAIADPRFLSKRFELVKEVVDSGSKCFFNFIALNEICEIDASILKDADLYLYDMVNHYYQQPMLSAEKIADKYRNDNTIQFREPFDHRIGFSQNPSIGVFGGRTITFQALQLAYQIGYRKIYLLGLDLGSNGKQTRFYEPDNNSKPLSSKLDQDYEPIIKPAFEYAGAPVQDNKVSILNLSAVSRLPDVIIPKCSLDEALAMLR